VHPFVRIFLSMAITSWVGMWLLGLLFRDGAETDQSMNQCRDSWFPELWAREVRLLDDDGVDHGHRNFPGTAAAVAVPHVAMNRGVVEG
jgi:hypothetical protein